MKWISAAWLPLVVGWGVATLVVDTATWAIAVTWAFTIPFAAACVVYWWTR